MYAYSFSTQFKSISFNSAHSFAFVSLLDIQALRLHRYQRSYAHKTTMLEGINLLLCSMVVLSFSMQSQSKRIENDEWKLKTRSHPIFDVGKQSFILFSLNFLCIICALSLHTLYLFSIPCHCRSTTFKDNKAKKRRLSNKRRCSTQEEKKWIENY